MLSYESLRLIWWLVIGILLMGFAVMDGFDMGAAFLLPFVSRNDSERRIVINTVGPVWEGNQAWLILGAGAIFAAWPYLYAVAFSGFYLAMFVVLGSLILRPVAFKFRSKMPDPRWRSVWDGCLFIGGTVPPVVFGIAFGNAILGVPFTFDDSLRMSYQGTFFGLFNPFALLCGLAGLSMIAMQGAAWLNIKTEGALQKRARKAIVLFALLTPALFIIAGIWAGEFLDGYRIVGVLRPDGPSNPLLKTVERVQGAWMDNYIHTPATLLVPALVAIGVILALWSVAARKPLRGFLGSSLIQIGVIGTAGVSMFPFLLPSSLNPDASLTVWDASSSRGTLAIMALMMAVFMPVIIAYTGWVYHVLRGKVTAVQVKEQGDTLY